MKPNRTLFSTVRNQRAWAGSLIGTEVFVIEVSKEEILTLEVLANPQGQTHVHKEAGCYVSLCWASRLEGVWVEKVVFLLNKRDS